jgi:hypothetical protein
LIYLVGPAAIGFGGAALLAPLFGDLALIAVIPLMAAGLFICWAPFLALHRGRRRTHQSRLRPFAGDERVEVAGDPYSHGGARLAGERGGRAFLLEVVAGHELPFLAGEALRLTLTEPVGLPAARAQIDLPPPPLPPAAGAQLRALHEAASRLADLGAQRIEVNHPNHPGLSIVQRGAFWPYPLLSRGDLAALRLEALLDALRAFEALVGRTKVSLGKGGLAWTNAESTPRCTACGEGLVDDAVRCRQCATLGHPGCQTGSGCSAWGCEPLTESDRGWTSPASGATPEELRCPYCHGDLTEEALVSCDGCSTRYHPECAAELGGCVTLGCAKQRRPGHLA